MMMRNYKGTLKVDHENRVILIRVATHKNASEAGPSNENGMETDEDSEKENRYGAKQRKQRVQDLKGKQTN